MKHALYILPLLFLSIAHKPKAQILQPVRWSFDLQHIANDEFDLVFRAHIDKGWYVYSQFLEGEGPIPTSFHFDEGTHYVLIGTTQESGAHRKSGFDPIFEMEVVKYAKEVTFTQRVRVKNYDKPITGWLEFMTCDDTRCLPPEEVDFQFDLKSVKKKTSSPQEEELEGFESANITPTTSEAANAETSATQNAPFAEAPTAQANSLNARTTQPYQGGLLDPVKWSARIEQIDSQTYDLTFEARIDKGWAIYSQHIEGDGPIPTSFFFDEKDYFSTIGEVKESGSQRISGFDPIFELNVTKYKHDAQFVQRIRTQQPQQPITGWLEYMTCDETRCLPPTTVSFYLVPGAGQVLIGAAAEARAPATHDTTAYGYAPQNPTLFTLPKPDLNSPIARCSLEGSTTSSVQRKSLWSIFFLGFIGGLLALLTPCVFPMIPLTVSFFTKKSGSRRKGIAHASLYGFFIFLVYLLLSVPFHLMDSINPDILNDISTNVWLNLAFFVIFVIFAFSFFGYYELTLPESWTNKASRAEGVGGTVGIFFMALTLALVSFSCTGPILGSLLAGALTSNGGAMQLTAGMGGFGLALALPFTLFAAFPSMLQSLPKSGGWLNTVKVVLGFIELALAFKFLSNADLVMKWGLLKIELFLGIWILIALGLAAYLFGFIRFPHDTPNQKVSPVRATLGLLSLAFAIYLATGFIYDPEKGTYRSLKLLSGLAPPAGYSWRYPKACPNNLECFHDLESGLAYAQKTNKPIMIDFTGHACVNCRKMEEHVWPEPEVDQLIRNEYVLISLYVDEKIELPEEEQVIVNQTTGGTRKLRRVGDKWSHFQTEFFNTNSQPYYVLLSPEGHLLTPPVGYTPDAKAYANFLRCGLEAFAQLKNTSQQKPTLGEAR